MSYYDDIIKRKRKFKYLYDTGHLIGCSALSERLLGAHKKNNSVKGADYADDVYNYGVVSLELGLYEHAKKLFDECAGIYANIQGSRIKQFDSLLNLGVTYSKLKEFDAAVAAFRRASLLADGEEVGPENVMEAAYNIANTYYLSGDFDKALHTFKGISESPEALSEKNRDLQPDIYSYIGYCHESKRNYADAAKWLKKAVSTTKALHGTDSREYLASVYYLAQFFAYTKSYEEALKYYSESVRVIRKIAGTNSAHYTDTINRIADMNAMTGNLDRSLYYRLKAIKLMKSQIGENHIYYANNLKNAALIYKEKGDLDNAEKFMRQSVKIKEGILGGTNPDFVRDVFQLCGVYLEKCEYDNALNVLQKTADSLKNADGAMKEIAGEITGICGFLTESGPNRKKNDAIDRLKRVERKMSSDKELWH